MGCFMRSMIFKCYNFWQNYAYKIYCSVQYHAHSKSALDQYQQQHAQQLQSEGMKRFGDKMLAFRTELELIDEFRVTNN